MRELVNQLAGPELGWSAGEVRYTILGRNEDMTFRATHEPSDASGDRYDSDPYDQVPYETRPDPLHHPDRLGTVAWLAGLDPAAPQRCRVLSLGCGNAAHLLPMAHRLPGSTFVGVERSRVAAQAARHAVETLGLENLRVIQADLDTFDSDELGLFDYIEAHGLFSWVPDPTRERVLALCARHLAPQGVATISYDTYPRWGVRGQLREALLLQAPEGDPPRVRLRKARQALRVLSESLQGQEFEFSRLLAVEVRWAQQATDSVLLHDYLAPHHRAFSLDEFLMRAAAHELSFVTDLATRLDGVRGPHLREKFAAYGITGPALESFVDLLRYRGLRRTVLCRRDARLDSRSPRALVERCHVVGALRPSGDLSLAEGEPVSFQVPESSTQIVEARAFAKAALYELGWVWPRSLAWRDLTTRALARMRAAGISLTADAVEAALDGLAVDLVALSDVEGLSLRLSALAPQNPSERPRIGELTRFEAERESWVTGSGHAPVAVDPFDRALIRLLDGQRPPSAVVGALYQMLRRGQLAMRYEGERVSDPGAIAQLLPVVIEQRVRAFAEQGLLAAVD